MHLANDSCRANVLNGVRNEVPEQQNFLYCSENVFQKIYCRISIWKTIHNIQNARILLIQQQQSELAPLITMFACQKKNH